MAYISKPLVRKFRTL